jgi:hypothetical protein
MRAYSRSTWSEQPAFFDEEQYETIRCELFAEFFDALLLVCLLSANFVAGYFAEALFKRWLRKAS